MNDNMNSIALNNIVSAIKYSDSSKILEFNSYTINYEK